MAMRMSGLMSGMDTESVIQQLVEARSVKVKTAKNSQTKLQWKQDIWKGLNNKLKTLQSKLNDLRFSSGYAKKVTKSSNEGIASVLTADSAVNGVHTLEVKRMAKTAYMTGGKVSRKDGKEIDITKTKMSDLMNIGYDEKKNLTLNKADGSQTVIDLTPETTVSEFLTKLKAEGLNANFDTKQNRFFISAKESGAAGDFMITGDAEALRGLGLNMFENKTAANSPKRLDNTDASEVRGSTRLDELMSFPPDSGDIPGGRTLSITKDNGESFEIQLTAYTRDENGVRHFNTVDDLVTQLRKHGVDAAFDPIQRKFTVRGDVKFADRDDDFQGYGDGVEQKDEGVLKALGLDSMSTSGYSGGSYVRGQDALITLNGAEFTSTNNTFEVNGLTITTQDVTEPGKSITLTTQQDTDGIYNMVKDFLKTYNEVINEIDKLYNADAAKDYEPLSDDEKSTMSESEIEKYEQKIKDSLLRRDGSLNSVGSALRNIMLSGFSVSGHGKMYLASFGISTLNYFAAPDNERNAYHIDGDPDDTSSSGNEDKLKSMIASDPDAVISFFSQLTQSLYTEMNKQSSSVEGYRSFGSFYDDKKMKSDYDDYKTKIKDLEKKLTDYEDKWYKKFAAMETAMAKLQQNSSAVTSLLGGQ
ncbi:MAG: flagellar filament capping protein FliD [Acetatifactor sp.]|nr:flagellar filament capping protein FliD [Acetatifactor sp.]